MMGQEKGRIGAFAATMLVTGNMVGSGIFLLPATGGAFGSIILFGWIAVVAGALLLALVFLNLSRIAPEAEMHAHVRAAFGAFAGWHSSFVYWVAAVVGNIAIAVAITGYLSWFVPALSTPRIGAAATAGAIIVMTLVNLAGPGLVARFSGLMLAAGLLPVVAVIAGGFFWFDPAIFQASWNVSGRPALAVVPASLGLLFWAFCGLESASVVAARVRDPARNVPIATLAGVLVAALVYVLACTLITGIIPAAALAAQAAPFALLFERVAGPASAAIVALCALLKASGTLGGWILVTAETARDGAKAGLFPRFMARTNDRDIPTLNLVGTAILMVAICFATLAPTIGRQFGTLINISVLFTLIAYIWCCLALIRRSAGRGPRLVAGASVLFCLAVIMGSDSTMLAACGLFLAITLPLYALQRLTTRPLVP